MTRQRMLLRLVLVAICVGASRAAPFGEEDEDFAENNSEAVYAEGCNVCADYRCPADPSECLLGTVPDTCGCCVQGACARLAGEPCWNASLAELPKERRNDGLCARNYLCLLRDDLEPEDTPEATCICMEPGPACGSNGRTYASSCELHEAAARARDSGLKLMHLGPCPSRPAIYTPPENVVADEGELVPLGCEVTGFPVPDIVWEFVADNGNTVLRLPDDELEDADVSTSEGPEALMRSSWLQLSRLGSHHVGTYHCIANNSVGEASAAASVSIA